MDHLGCQMDQLGCQMDQLGRQMDQLGCQMDQLGRQMDQLGSQMDRLGSQMDSHGSWTCIKRKEITHGNFFDFHAQKWLMNKIPRDQNRAMRGFWEKGIFLTFPHEKTTFRWSKVVSEAIFPTN